MKLSGTYFLAMISSATFVFVLAFTMLACTTKSTDQLKEALKNPPTRILLLWTGKAWQWNIPSKEDETKVVNKLKLAQEALDELNKPFHLASAGWIMGPPNNGSLFDDILKKRCSNKLYEPIFRVYINAFGKHCINCNL